MAEDTNSTNPENSENSEKSENTSWVRKQAMTFKEFCEITNKIVLVPKGQSRDSYDFDYAFNPKYHVDFQPVSLFGTCFPNDEGIKDLYERFRAKARHDVMLKHAKYLPDVDRYFTDMFVKKLKEEELNIRQFEKDPFEETEKFLKPRIIDGLEGRFSNNTMEELISVMGKAYESMNLFHMDIRISAFNTCPYINVIGSLEKIQIGYVGEGFIVPKLEK